MTKKLYVKTLGCAMNERDSDHIIAELKAKESYDLTNEPRIADLIIINTCSVREKPEQKLFSEIGQFAKIKKQDAKIGVCGCTASALGEEILKKSRHVSFVLGARNVSKISQIIHQKDAVEVDINYDDSAYIFQENTNSKVRAMLNISIGCDKKCTYCIVPLTRGKEISIPEELILAQAQKVVSNGAKEILLIGQNVNNYGARFSTKHIPTNFTKLLQKISQVEGLKRIRFISPHPLHMDDEFLQEFASNQKICKSIHIPLQSGSSNILKAMKRGYTKEWYLERIKKLREYLDANNISEVGISTDVIVGFPGEGDEDFDQTIDVLNEVKFDSLYSFIYSERTGTKAPLLESKVPLEVAKKRLEILKSAHKKILRQKARELIGKEYEVLIEQNSNSLKAHVPNIRAKTSTNEHDTNTTNINYKSSSEGRSDTNRFISIDGIYEIGSLVKVKITYASGGSLRAKAIL